MMTRLNFSNLDTLSEADFLALVAEFQGLDGSDTEKYYKLSQLIRRAPWRLEKGVCVRRPSPAEWAKRGPSGPAIKDLQTKDRLFDFFNPRRTWATGALGRASSEDQALILTLDALIQDGALISSHRYIAGVPYDAYEDTDEASEDYRCAHRASAIHGKQSAAGQRWSAYCGLAQLYPAETVTAYNSYHVPYCVIAEQSRVAFIAGNNSPDSVLQLVAAESIRTLGIVHFEDCFGYEPQLGREDPRWSVPMLHFSPQLLSRMAAMYQQRAQQLFDAINSANGYFRPGG